MTNQSKSVFWDLENAEKLNAEIPQGFDINNDIVKPQEAPKAMICQSDCPPQPLNDTASKRQNKADFVNAINAHVEALEQGFNEQLPPR